MKSITNQFTLLKEKKKKPKKKKKSLAFAQQLQKSLSQKIFFLFFLLANIKTR